MAAFLKLKPSLFKLRPLILHQRFCHTTVFEGCSEADLFVELGPISMECSGDADTSKCKKLDAKSIGLTLSMIPHASRTVIKFLQSEGHDAYLVGGCVRDMLLNRIPKNFNVITTANLKEIKKKFHHAYIIGRKFPICKVYVNGFTVEVSSFDTVSTEEEKEVLLSEMPKGYDKKDLIIWRNSLHRDFTVNSLFYDPFAHKIYDYSNGVTDLKAMKIRTLVPAHSSFEVDCARILRGLGLAACLGFSFAKDTEKAIQNLYASVKTLDKARLMMEMGYMLSYGAAQSSLLLLKRFKLLDMLLPFHAAYLADNSGGKRPQMLMELFSKLDGVVSSDHPCDSALWVSLLVFHLALVNNPQDALVVWTLSGLLYRGTWEEGVKAAREHSKEHVNFAPEICNTYDEVADKELEQKVFTFASIILESISVLTDSKSLQKIMHNYPSPFPVLVFVSKDAGRAVADIFKVLVDDIKSLKKRRHSYAIDYELLRLGEKSETRYVLGKVIMDTMKVGMTQQRPKLLSEKKDNFYASKPRVKQVEISKKLNGMAFKHRKENHKGGGKQRLEGQTTNKQKLVEEKLGEILSCHGFVNRKQQLKKGEVEDVKKFLSMYKETIAEQDMKPEIRQGHVKTSEDTPTVLKEIPSTKQHETLPSNHVLHVLEAEPKTGEKHDDQAHEEAPSVQENISKVLKPHQDVVPTEILNVLKVSNFLKADDDHRIITVNKKGRQQLEKKASLSSFFK